MDNLIKWYLEVIKFLEKDLRIESEGWVASIMVVRSLGRKVSVDLMAKEF